jgi:hypothetical protein
VLVFAALMAILLISIGGVQSASILPVAFYRYVFSSDLVAPVEGAVVIARNSDGLGGVAIACANWQGYYEGGGDLPPGWYRLQASHQSYFSQTEYAYYDGHHPVPVDLWLCWQPFPGSRTVDGF